MTQNRVGGPSPADPNKGPDTRLQEQHRRIEKIEKVRAVDETENERRRKQFQKFMEEKPPEPEERSPSPLETEFYKVGEGIEQSLFEGPDHVSSSLEDLGKDAIASPSYSPAPDCTTPPEPEENETPPLPRSHKFWTHVDSPPDQKTKKTPFQETKGLPAPASKKTPHESSHKNPAKSLYGPPGKSIEEKSQIEKEAERKKTAPTPLQEEIAPWQQREKKQIQESKISDTAKKTKEKKVPILPSEEEVVSLHEKQFELQREKEEKGKKFSPIEIQSPSTSHLPATIIPLAETAAVRAAPYLNAQTTALFFQIVGTIYVMTTTSGVSKTEILLNAPSFANSKFFGSTISIEKYATAPDSLNIRLTGTDEAVTTFNQNISSLYAAFQNGNFNFRIGRISAEYSIEKPLFRRKESRGGNEGGDFSDKRGKK